jgi:hypothetical protein
MGYLPLKLLTDIHLERNVNSVLARGHRRTGGSFFAII